MGDAENGRKLFMKYCAACHLTDGKGPNKAGPNLKGIIGKSPAHDENFTRWSLAIRKSDIIWNDENLDKLMRNPKLFLPGTTMRIPGVHKAEDRRDIIAFLKTV